MAEIEFDPTKDAANRGKHGVGLAAAAILFDGPILRQPDDRRVYGEERFLAIGKIGEAIFVCVYTMRRGHYRVISLRPGNRKERRRYAEVFTETDPESPA